MEEPFCQHDIALLNRLGSQDSLSQLVCNLERFSQFQLVKLLHMTKVGIAWMSLKVWTDEDSSGAKVVEKVLEDVNWIKEEE